MNIQCNVWQKQLDKDRKMKMAGTKKSKDSSKVFEHKSFVERLKEYDGEIGVYDFNMDNDVEINPMTHSKELFDKRVDNYPFFNNIEKEGVVLYAA